MAYLRESLNLTVRAVRPLLSLSDNETVCGVRSAIDTREMVSGLSS